MRYGNTPLHDVNDRGRHIGTGIILGVTIGVVVAILLTIILGDRGILCNGIVFGTIFGVLFGLVYGFVVNRLRQGKVK